MDYLFYWNIAWICWDRVVTEGRVKAKVTKGLNDELKVSDIKSRNRSLAGNDKPLKDAEN